MSLQSDERRHLCCKIRFNRPYFEPEFGVEDSEIQVKIDGLIDESQDRKSEEREN